MAWFIGESRAISGGNASPDASAPSWKSLTWMLERPGDRQFHLCLYSPGAKIRTSDATYVADSDVSVLRVVVDLLHQDVLSTLAKISEAAVADEQLASTIYSAAMKAVEAREPESAWAKADVTRVLLSPDF